MKRSCECGRIRSVKPAERRLGRLLERHQRASKFYEATVSKLQLNDVVLPTRKGLDIRLRCVTVPEPELAIILQKLKLAPPKRLKNIPNL